MPAIVGPIYIMSISGDAAASFGDVFAIAPKSVDHTGAGSGTFQLGDFAKINNEYSKTNFNDADIIDDTVSFNG
ncbi:spore germination protein [Bacillus mojavensis]|uniref:spore germination protein n=1 Tax=Bacillus mojavensis TaxID=72360 RepID=UPI002DB5BDFE|nr:spore germination protein [Bacillus mojavensis]MEC1292376.1 spore germination protein [Bacillus mojavensis]MEC1614331.1 spore germination protein [Bacillus mojavensis]MEC1620299.1 spore germination protein [Bacillus mojavensis]MEC1634670.1 spore germination protein [Bacillus mojavensis]MEC1658002.1 spore germination protein [Bacillus mojavensis]